MMMKGMHVACDGIKQRNKSVENAKEMSEKVRKMNSPPPKESDGRARRRRRAADDDSGEEDGAEVEAKTADEVRLSELISIDLGEVLYTNQKSMFPLAFACQPENYTSMCTPKTVTLACVTRMTYLAGLEGSQRYNVFVSFFMKIRKLTYILDEFKQRVATNITPELHSYIFPERDVDRQ